MLSREDLRFKVRNLILIFRHFWFYVWALLLFFCMRRMVKAAWTYNFRQIANRSMHTLRHEQRELVITWVDMSEPSALSREEIVAMEAATASERARMGWQK